MYLLNAGWPILFASTVQQVYDFNIIALKLAEQVRLPVIVAYDGFFTSHQKGRCFRFAEDEAVRTYIGKKTEPYPFLDLEHPITVGSYMNEPDLINNRYQLHLAMEQADVGINKIAEVVYTQENYIDEMNEEISGFLMRCYKMEETSQSMGNKINKLLQITSGIEALSDECTSIVHSLQKYITKTSKKTSSYGNSFSYGGRRIF